MIYRQSKIQMQECCQDTFIALLLAILQ